MSTQSPLWVSGTDSIHLQGVVMNLSSFARIRSHFRAGAMLRILPLGIALALQGAASAQLAPSAEKQIQEIYAFKKSLTASEKKMSSNLALASRIARGVDVGNLAHFVSPLPRDSQGRFEVEIRGYLSPGLLNSPAMKGAEQVNDVVPAGAFRTGHLRAHLKETDLQALAASSDVVSISEPKGY